MSTDAANHDTGRDSRNLPAAGFGQVSRQVAPKGQSAQPTVLGTLDALVVLMAVRAFETPVRPKHAHICPECSQLFSCRCSFGWKLAEMRCGCVQFCSICRQVHGEEVIHASE